MTNTEHSPTGESTTGVRQLRVVVEDYEQAVTFYRDVLGLSEEAAFQGR